MVEPTLKLLATETVPAKLEVFALVTVRLVAVVVPMFERLEKRLVENRFVVVACEPVALEKTRLVKLKFAPNKLVA